MTDQGRRIQAAFSGRVAASHPNVSDRLIALRSGVQSSSGLPPRLLELVRLRIAFHNQCRSCMAIRNHAALEDGLTEELVCSLERPAEATGLTPAERSALHYADLLATDHLAIDDSVHAELRQQFDESQIVALGLYCAYSVGFGRLAATWHLVEDLPEPFRCNDDIVTPGAGAGVVVE